MLYIAVLISFFLVFILIYGILMVVSRDRLAISNRINIIKGFHEVNLENSEGKSFSERALLPFYLRVSHYIVKITPKNKLAALNKKLEKAGLLKNSTAEKWLFDKSMLLLIITIAFSALIYVIEPDILKTSLIALILVTLINVFFNFYLSRRIDMRKKKILKDMPYIVDLITVSVEAGLSFDGAIVRVINNISGELCDEFVKCLKEMRMGIERRTALKNMSDRCDTRELSMLITSIIQADELGVTLGNVLRIEAENIRERRKQAAREKAFKVPIKMLFPLIFFIFPSIFIIILGPAAIKIYNMFLK